MKSNKIAANSIDDGMIKLFLLYVLYQLLLHAYFSLASNDPRLLLPHVIAYLHDIALLAIVTAIGYFVTAVSPTGFRQTVNKIGSVFIAIVGILLASYPKILREYLAFPVNIFESDLDSATTLISDYLGITALLPALIALILSVLVLFTPLEKVHPVRNCEQRKIALNKKQEACNYLKFLTGQVDEVRSKPLGQADGGFKPPSTNNVRGRSSL